MMLRNVLLLSLLVFLAASIPKLSYAQAPTPISGIINNYTSVTAISQPACGDCDLACIHTITVSDPTGLAVGDQALIIQMKGATINTANAAGSGNVTAINNAGNYEFFEIGAISGNVLTPRYPLIRSYTVSGRVQVVRIPNYETVDITASLTSLDWDDAAGIGGVVALKARKVSFSANIDMQGRGYQGIQMPLNGTPDNCGINPNTQYVLPSTNNSSYIKGDGIVVNDNNTNRGRSPRANGGGSGVSGDSGGGGGSNYGAGGVGGWRWCDELGPQDGTNPEIAAGGVGGFSLTPFLAQDKVFMGGAGGPGWVSTNNPSTAADGGGIVIIFSDTIVGNNFTINAFGLSPTAVNPVGAPDGGGGGGAGGTVVLKTETYIGNINLNISGGQGQDLNTTDYHGPGGGGGGGVLLYSLAAIPTGMTINATGGTGGQHSDAFRNGTTDGAAGGTISLYVPIQNPNYAGNVDNDLISTSCDIDDDNDGIPDIVEIYIGDHDGDGTPDYADPDFCAATFQGVNGWNCATDGLPDPSGDMDGDGRPNFKDPDFPYCSGLNDNGACANMDADGDGSANHLDLDADNDGIPDIIEAGGVDTNGDGFVDDNTDTDSDGLADTYDNDDTDGPGGSSPCSVLPNCLQNASTSLLFDTNNDGINDRTQDTDGDGLPDYIDLDADNDGIPDVVEAGGVDENGDGRADNYVDYDGDGFNDVYDASVLTTTTTITNHSDTSPDDCQAGNAPSHNIIFNSGTADADGNVTLTFNLEGDYGGDFEEFTLTGEGATPIGGLFNRSLSNNPGYADCSTPAMLFTVTIPQADWNLWNNDGVVNITFQADADVNFCTNRSCISNTTATYTSTDVVVSSNSGTPMFVTGADTNGDGLADSYPGGDNDLDGILNHLDLDADNDGIADVAESGGTDANGDGRADNYIDADNDGFNDVVDGDPSNALAVGNDGAGANTADALILTGADTNGDGAPNSYPNKNNDGDNIPNYLDLDADNDGIADVVEAGGTDANGDGLADNYVDADNDGFNDVVDGDPTNALAVGSDAAGANTTDALVLTGADTNGDGAPNSYITGDMDGDMILNFLDIDADDDGIVDLLEVGGVDADGNGLVDGYTDTDGDGWSENVDASGTVLILTGIDGNGDGNPDDYPQDNLDAHGFPNFLDIDADNDGIVDNTEAQLTAAYVAPSGVDSDGDGLDDAYETVGQVGVFGGQGAIPVNTDGTDNPDYLDLDTDNDGISDFIEGHDTNGDGLVNGSDAPNAGTGIGGALDADNDGLLDGFDNNTASTDATNTNLNANSHPNVDEAGTPERDWREIKDTDNDGIADNIDIDDDNDGILDIDESNGVDPLADANGDGTPNYLDPTFPGYVDTNGDGINDNFDNDKDGIINALDLDADNDGIPDIVEAGGVDTDGDGRIDSNVDADNDGLMDLYDNTQGGDAITNADTDGDGIPNYLDLDADNDGIPDVVEAGGTDANGDGIIDNYVDTDRDGFSDVVDGDVGNDGVADNTANALMVTGPDTDNDGIPNTYPEANNDGDAIPNYLDLDADNDGIPDVVEAGGTDVNGDGRVDNYADLDGDGFNDVVDGDVGNDGVAENSGNALILTGADTNNDGTPNSYPNKNNDGDNIPNYLDLDADNDGIPDVVEAGGTDANGDGLADNYIDADNDGFNDVVDGDPSNALAVGSDAAGANTTDALILTGADTNGDGAPNSYPNKNNDGDALPNYLDLDADNDGIPDVVEAGGTDANGDGVADNYVDTDNDGFNDVVDGDVGNDGVAENSADALILTGADTNGDGTPNTYPNGDFDGDGILNYLDLDADNDGVQDILEALGVDANGDGMVDGYTDSDNDGYHDPVDGDVGNDGTAENTVGALVVTSADTNADGAPESYPEANADSHGMPNFLDLDSDNDGITDVVENASGVATAGATTDSPSGTVLDAMIEDGGITDGNNNGWSDLKEGTTTIVDTDGDGIYDPYDIDADNDGIPDFLEGTCSTCPTFGAPGGGDINGNGILDMYETLNFANGNGGGNSGINPNEDDNDGTAPPDYLDLDTDEDAAPDWAEGFDSGFGGGAAVAGDGSAGHELINMAAAYVANGGPAGDYPTTDSDGDGLPDWMDNLVGPGVTISVAPPFLNPASPFWHDIDNDGLADLLDPNVAGNSWGTLAPVPDNDAINDRDWRDFFSNVDLPIELITFNAVRQDASKVLLTWATASELNNKGFDVERMLDNETEFSKIGFVDGMGTSVGTNEYSFNDNNAYAGVSYYRLRQVDFDETFEYTDTRAVTGLSTLGGQVSVYPVPATSFVNVSFNGFSTDLSNVRFELVDVLGRVLLTKTQDVNAYQTVQITEINKFVPGNYILRVTVNKTEIMTFKVIKK